MKEWSIDAVLLLIVGIIVAVSLFLGVITAVKKSFKVSPSPKRIDSSEIIRDQKRRMEDINRQQESLTRERQQKLRDLRNKR